MKKCSAWLITRETQTKTTVRYHTLHWSAWPSLKNLQITNAGEGAEKREPSFHIAGEAQFGAATVENSMMVPQRTKGRLAMRPSNPSFGRKPSKTRLQKNTGTTVATEHHSHQPRHGTHPKCPPTDEWIKRMRSACRHRQREASVSHKKARK